MFLLGIAVLVALALISLGSLISIFLAAVLALGLDPVVGALVRRGWKRGRAALVVFAALFVSVFALVVLSIYLRQKGSPQSKRVAAPHDETGE
jgi:predicted PurR-regulated permease PerM